MLKSTLDKLDIALLGSSPKLERVALLNPKDPTFNLVRLDRSRWDKLRLESPLGKILPRLKPERLPLVRLPAIFIKSLPPAIFANEANLSTPKFFASSEILSTPKLLVKLASFPAPILFARLLRLESPRLFLRLLKVVGSRFFAKSSNPPPQTVVGQISSGSGFIPISALTSAKQTIANTTKYTIIDNCLRIKYSLYTKLALTMNISYLYYCLITI